MRLGSKAKLTIGAGLMAATTFGFLGVRELSRSSASAVAPIAANVSRPAQHAGIVFAATNRDVKIGETIGADMIRNAVVDPGKVPGVATPAEVIGKVATRNIAANMLIPREALEQEGKLAIRVPVGMRAISIDTTAEIAVAGLVRPGDRVDVQVVYPGEDAISGTRGNGRSRARALLQMVPVLAVGDFVLGTQSKSGLGEGASPPPPARTVTLALTPQQVSELSLAKSTGALYLSLRNPEDSAEVSPVQIASSPEPAPRAIAAAPAPLGFTPPTRPRAAAPTLRRDAPHAIELVVGGNREVIYSGSGSR